MKLEEQVITLEQAKKLKELGFERDSIYVYMGEYNTIKYREERLECESFNIRTYTASELMDILPISVQKEGLYHHFEMYKHPGGGMYGLRYKGLCGHDNKNLAQALGDMLIYLIENNLFPVK